MEVRSEHSPCQRLRALETRMHRGSRGADKQLASTAMQVGPLHSLMSTYIRTRICLHTYMFTFTRHRPVRQAYTTVHSSTFSRAPINSFTTSPASLYTQPSPPKPYHLYIIGVRKAPARTHSRVHSLISLRGCVSSCGQRAVERRRTTPSSASPRNAIGGTSTRNTTTTTTSADSVRTIGLSISNN